MDSAPEGHNHGGSPLRELQQAPWRRLLAVARPHIGWLALALVGLLLSTAIGLAFPLIIGETVGQVLAARDVARLDQFVLVLLGLFAIQSLGEFLQTYALGLVGERVVYDLRTALYGQLLRLSLDFYGRRRTGELVSRLSSDVTLLRALLTTNATGLIAGLVSLIGALTIVFVLNPTLTLLLLVLAPAIVGVALGLGRPLERLSTQVQDDLARATTTTEEGISGIRVVKSFAREAYEHERFTRDSAAALASALRVTRLRAGFNALLVFLGFGAVAGIVWFAGRQVIAGAMTVPLLTSFLIYGVQIGFGLGQLAQVYAEVRQALGAARRVFELLDTEPSLTDAPDAVALGPLRGSIQFEGVSFGYQPDALVLHDINLAIAPGEIVALVGPSGAGKSTLFNLIPRFYDPLTGAVRVDGVDLRAVTQESLRRQVGLVPQETTLFGGTVRENIRYGRLDTAEHEVVAAAEAANAHDFISGLPDAYGTVVGERGARLSGGQRQRVAIARAILKDPRILLLDEATSALDNESERLVQGALERLMTGRTTVIIAHRLSTVRMAHRIVVMDNGRIVEVDAHSELMARGGLYARLYALQFQEAELGR